MENNSLRVFYALFKINWEDLIEFFSTGLKITKKNPIWYNNRWRLPNDIVILEKIFN